MNADSLLRSATLGIVAALVAVVIVYLIADAASGPLITAQPGSDAAEIPLGGAIFSTVVRGLVGTAIAFLSDRTSRPVEIFVGICVVALVLYGLVALSVAEDTATGIWLNVMHIAAAVPIVGFLAQWLRGRQLSTV